MLVSAQLVAAYLERLSKSGKTVFYIDVTDHFGLPKPNSNWRNHVLCRIFTQLDEEDALAGRPFRTSMVIRSSNGHLPGMGYFTSLNKLRGIPVPSGRVQMRLLHESEKANLIAYYRSQGTQ